DMRRYLQLPANLDPRVTALARDITTGGSTPADKASRIEAYLRKNYKYTLNLTWAPGIEPLNTFLFDAKNGHCEYFASAMAILSRAAGIPTRLVNGFQMGEFNPVGSDYIVRESDAHSWVEAYFPERGWVEFDPTPPDMRMADTGISAQLAHYADAMELVWSTYILVYDTDSQSQLFRSAEERMQSLQSDFRDGSDTLSARTKKFWDRLTAALGAMAANFRIWVIVLVTAATAWGFQNRRALRIRWQIRKLRKGRGATSGEMVAYLFYRAARLAARRRPARKPAQTWREWTLGLPDENRRSIVFRALGVFEKSAYGREPASLADLAVLEGAIRELKGGRTA
ncbi:MAG TPA: transglutaminase-like domain-containing protein, partial [Terriglobia bacterium]|nr:transglutaminase-like domain-containing protein [Terriglobia bacterium]